MWILTSADAFEKALAELDAQLSTVPVD